MTTPGRDAVTLYHYTCDHGRRDIGDEGWLYAPCDLVKMPTVPAWQRPLFEWIWFTDLDTPDRAALGLSSRTIACDRTEHRYRVLDAALVARWTTFRRQVPRPLREGLETVAGVLPAHWWVSSLPVPVMYDPIFARAAS